MSVRHIEMSAPLEWPGRGHRQAAASWHGLEGLPGDGQVFVLSAGQVDSDRLAAFADNMDAQLRHAIETETTRKSLRSAIRLAIRGHQATDRGVEIRAEPFAPHRRVVCVTYQSIIMSTRLARKFRAELLELVGRYKDKAEPGHVYLLAGS
jgi:hypothetical protein